MVRRSVLALAAVALATLATSAADPVPVKGSKVKYEPAVAVMVGDKAVNLALTGVGLRSKLGFGVYAVGSYLQDGAAARSAEELVKADAVKVLHLVMERDVSAREFVDAFRSAIAKSHPPDTFRDEFAQVAKAVGEQAAKKGDHIILLATPGAGVRIQLVGKADVTVKNAAFAQALWEVYLGEKPVDENLKRGLVAMLAR
jgi:hypothetical protein